MKTTVVYEVESEWDLGLGNLLWANEDDALSSIVEVWDTLDIDMRLGDALQSGYVKIKQRAVE